MQGTKKQIEFNKNWRVIDGNNQLQLINIVNSRQLIIEGPQPESKHLFDTIRKERYLGDIVKKFTTHDSRFSRQWVIKYINELEKVGIVRQTEVIPSDLTPKYLEGLDRQLDFLSELRKDKNKYENQLLLKNTKIAILGLGSIGQWIILPLVTSGVGFFKCVDFDIVEDRNIGRQPIFRREDVGKPKSEVVARFISSQRHGVKAIPINTKLSKEEDIEKIIQDCDIVLQCCDLPRFIIHRWINNVCLRLNKPNLLAYSGRIGPFCIPNKTACYGCLESKLRRDFILYDDLVDNIGSTKEIERFPELAVVASMTGSLAAKEVIAYILGLKTQTVNAFLDINPFTFEVNTHVLHRNVRCYACGKK